MLDCSKAKSRLGWKPKLSLEDALKLTGEWYTAEFEKKDLQALTHPLSNAFPANSTDVTHHQRRSTIQKRRLVHAMLDGVFERRNNLLDVRR